MDDGQGLQVGMCLALLGLAGTCALLGVVVLQLVGRVNGLMTEVAELGRDRAAVGSGCGGLLLGLLIGLGVLGCAGLLLLQSVGAAGP
ncbi:MAG: hypothetical protein M3Z04_16805 [Chloroflexota bacterium]|nr:hypothetical protein [Chloroflexota bacterium]